MALDHWELDGNALANIPSWALAGSVWAPAALPRGGVTLLYYTVRQASTGRQCLTVAAGSSPGGPFLDGSFGPTRVRRQRGHRPEPVRRRQRQRVPAVQDRTALAPLEPPAGPGRPQLLGPVLAPPRTDPSAGRTATSRRRPCCATARPTGSSTSGNDWNGEHYAEGVAKCSSPSGPCTADSRNPILASRAGAAGPGGGEVFTGHRGELVARVPRLPGAARRVPQQPAPLLLADRARRRGPPDDQPVMRPSSRSRHRARCPVRASVRSIPAVRARAGVDTPAIAAARAPRAATGGRPRRAACARCPPAGSGRRASAREVARAHTVAHVAARPR